MSPLYPEEPVMCTIYPATGEEFMTIITSVLQIDADVTDFTWQQTLWYLLFIIHTVFHSPVFLDLWGQKEPC